MNTIYSIGYGNWKKLQQFVQYLKMLEVNALVDIRRFPKSKNPDFIKENLETELPKYGIKYEFMGEVLGGFRRGGYQKFMETEEYKSGINQLLEMLKETNVAIMCIERDSKYCHRRFVMQTLFNMGVHVVAVEE
jgi:uncharacterized protein (DUF488 family)